MGRRNLTAGLLLACALAIVSCARPDLPRDPEAPALAPPPLQMVGLGALAMGTVMRLWCAEGAPETIAPTEALNTQGTVTWLGHSGFVIQLAGQSVIVDPILTEGALTTAGLGGRIAAAPDLSGLAKLDAVIISHNDNDHLDRPTLRALAERFPEAALILPEGNKLSPPVRGFAEVIELRAWQSHKLGALEVTATPAIHFGRRAPFAWRRSPALGMAFSGDGRRVFFSGDTAYGPVFAEIGERLGPFDLALLSIGTSRPAALVNDQHMTPEQAVRLASDIGARRAVPHHYGTFRTTPDSPAEVLTRFKAAAESGLDVVALPVGGSTCIAPH
ncbi:MAG: MBL fold metallo-hydrolase [Rhodobacteraceae bacterium]|nr:MAG: MBL fold metallo-hydrolase [Paracoccaceae bacterium]